MSTHVRLEIVILSLGAAAWPGAALAPDQLISKTASETLVAFVERPASPPVPNQAWRRLEAENQRFNKQGWLEATTQVDPEHGFTFAVVDQGGSGLIRGRVLTPALEAEAESVAGGRSATAFTPANYIVTIAGETDDGLVKLALEARRKETGLLNGFALVTPGDARLVRVEGRLAKNPSFWTTQVDIVRRYEDVGGHRMLVELESEAQIRIFGTSRFRMQIRYESVNGTPVPDVPTAPAHARDSVTLPNDG